MNQRNFQKELDQLLEKIDNEPKKTLFLHCCCAPCSSYVTEYLSAHFHLVLFFYNPNITEEDEYEKRKQELLRLISEKEYPGKIDIVEAEKRQSAMEQIISARHCRSVHIKMQEN